MRSSPVRDTRAAIDAGTDNFELGGIGLPPAQVLTQVPDDRLDDMVRRILTAMFSVGLFDHPNTGDPAAIVSTPEHRDLAVEIAQAGAVLAEERRRRAAARLPRCAPSRSSGTTRAPARRRSWAAPASVRGGPVVTPLTAITSRAGQDVTVTHADGTLGVVALSVVPADVLAPSSGTGPGAARHVLSTMDLSGSPVAAFVSPTIDATNALPPGRLFGAMERLHPPVIDGDYRFSLRYAGVVRLYVDGRLVARGDSHGLDFLLRARRR
jgi:beta-glucosidase